MKALENKIKGKRPKGEELSKMIILSDRRVLAGTGETVPPTGLGSDGCRDVRAVESRHPSCRFK